VAKERNNIYAITADAVDLALDTAGAIGSMVGGLANAVGIGGSEKEKSDEHEQQRRDADDAAQRVATSLREEAEAVKPRSHKAPASGRHVSKTHATKSKSIKKTTKSRAARKATR
jgi:hypothetical protein